MKKSILFITAAVLLVGFALGTLAANLYKKIDTDRGPQKPVLGVEEKRWVVNEDTQIVYEQEYTRCGHVVISEFKDHQSLVGKSLDEIKLVYRPENGYQVYEQAGALIIHQQLDAWCPQDQEKYRLKEYNGRVAIFKGPDAEHDVLLRVTRLPMEALPEKVQNDIRCGNLVFDNEQALNDALENLDEYV
ncbi:hypothetical protein ACU70A_10705 [Syntrophomonas erecta subsp. sporosyntropha]